MKGKQACPGRVLGAVLLAVVSLGLAALPVLPAGAHARITGTDPADGAVLDAAPARVTIHLRSKPATVEGDPLRVYGPAGERVDDGRVTVLGDDATALSVGLSSGVPRPGGEYHVAYRLISSDTHLIAGRFSFRTLQPVEVGTAGLPSAAQPAAYGRPRSEHWPRYLAAVGLAVAAVGLAGGWHRRKRQLVGLRTELARARRAAVPGPARRAPTHRRSPAPTHRVPRGADAPAPLGGRLPPPTPPAVEPALGAGGEAAWPGGLAGDVASPARPVAAPRSRPNGWSAPDEWDGANGSDGWAGAGGADGSGDAGGAGSREGWAGADGWAGLDRGTGLDRRGAPPTARPVNGASRPPAAPGPADPDGTPVGPPHR